MRTLSGNLVGTGADIYVCLGFQPDFVKLTNGTSRTVCEYSVKDTVKNTGGIAVAAAGTRTKAAAGITLFDNSDGLKAPASNTAYLVRTADGTYTWEAAVEGDILPDGFKIDASCVENIDTNKLFFEAGNYDG